MSDPAETAAELVRVYRHIEKTAMADVPVLNRALSVEVAGMTRTDAGLLCVLITPWFINLVLMPEAPLPPVQPGTKSKVTLPGGMFEFISSHHEDLGAYRMCSLMSPVFEFEAQADAVTLAGAILDDVLAAKDAEDAEDADMLAVWEGRLPQIKETGGGVNEAQAVSGTDPGAKRLSRRAMFGLRPTEEAAQ